MSDTYEDLHLQTMTYLPFAETSVFCLALSAYAQLERQPSA